MNGYNTLAYSDAETSWYQARRKTLFQRISCFLSNRPIDLISFDDARTHLHLEHKVFRGLQEIELSAIKGSVGRYKDFTSKFLPKKKYLAPRWKRIKSQAIPQGIPPIEVYKVSEIYFVVDGNHRVSVALQEGWTTIEAYVYEFKSPIHLSPKTGSKELLRLIHQAG